ncbi:MAG TPA: ATP-binding protein [Rhodanobacteraceae bacterium]|nr:ATP-binding protein [Rhodanobacteraceae bacterium]
MIAHDPRNGVDLGAQIHSFASVLRGAARQPLGWRIDLENATGRDSLDTTQFKAALLNLVLNAREANADAAELTLSACNVELAENADVAPRPVPGRYAAITLTDRNMTPDAARHMLEPFAGSKELRHGTGLGLSQVYGFASQSGGAVGITSVAGQGTSVTIYLPLAAALADGAGTIQGEKRSGTDPGQEPVSG